MSLQADVVSYWGGNGSLNPTPLWAGLAPEQTAFPYAILTVISSAPTYVTNGPRDGYVEDFQFQISVYDSDPDNALAFAETVRAEFEGQSISSACMAVFRTNGPVFVVDQDTPKLVFHAWVSFQYQARVS